MDVETTAPSQRNVVGVILEDLLLGQLLFEMNGDQRLGRFAREVLLQRQPEAARQLHGERRGALRQPAGGDVDISRFQNAQRIEPGMLKEALVFHRRHRVHQMLGKIGKLHQPPLLPVLIEKIRDQLRLQRIAGQFGVVT